jgi:phytoene dehydrogenase-like protein
MAAPDAVVIGAGPNGLAAAIVLARARRKVILYEAQADVGGGCKSEELTLPGFVHDVCSAIHPMGVASPWFRSLPLRDHGLEWIEPSAMIAHPLDTEPAAMSERSLADTAARLGVDEGPYRRLIGSVVDAWPLIGDAILAPPGLPRHPIAVARFGWHALKPAERLARSFSGARARGLFAGIAAHGMVPLDSPPTGAVALVLGALAHTHGWPFPKGGAQRLSNALASYFRSLGGEIQTNARVTNIDELPSSAKTVLCDLSPRPLLAIAGHTLPEDYRRKLERFQYGTGVFKVDWALAAPIPWRDPAVARAGTVHVGGTLEEIAASERDCWEGRISARPFVLLAQHSLFDPSRAPEGCHTAWGYCHVPAGATADMLPAIEGQIERFAPGFRDRVLARHVITPADFERRNPNLVGGDIAMGVTTLRQMVVRPTLSWYRTPRKGLYICSASTPPGVGVHGMCGYFAARAALSDSEP